MSLNYLLYYFFFFLDLSVSSTLFRTEISKQTSFNNNTFEKENLPVNINENSCGYVGSGVG